MPKKKKKGSGGGDDDGKSPSDTQAEAATPSKETTPGPASSVPTGEAPSVLTKAPTVSRQLPPFMRVESTVKDRDPNAKLLGGSDMAEMEQALRTHTESHANTSGGMNVFAINKDGISRAVVKFIDKPRPQPLTICFHFPGTFLTHKYVVAIIQAALTTIEGAEVTAVQYCDRNVRLGTRGLENRWLVTVSEMRAKQMLMLKGIKVVSRTIYVKSYDEVIGDEYREYQRWAELQNRMKGFGVKKKPDTPVSASSPSDGTGDADSDSDD